MVTVVVAETAAQGPLAATVLALAMNALIGLLWYHARPFAIGDPLDRARRDLELFVLQHRLDPIVAKAGARALDEEASS